LGRGEETLSSGEETFRSGERTFIVGNWHCLFPLGI
jgi:hypothetical protein